MTKFLRSLSIIFFTLALAGVAVLWLSDASHRLLPNPGHSRLGAVPLISIALSYISFQLSDRRKLAERSKGLLLGFAFLIWGCEQLLPPSPWVTVIDNLVITIFVVDLALIVIEHLRRKDHDLP